MNLPAILGGDLVIEVSRAKSALEEGLSITRKGGKYLLIGIRERKVDPYIITRKNLRDFGSYSACQPICSRA